MKNLYAVYIPNKPFLEFFTYSSEKEIKNGTRVLVSFGKLKKEVLAYVFGQGIKGDFEIKEISQVLDENPIFSSKLLKFLTYMANYYQAPLATVFYSATQPKLKKSKIIKRKKIYDFSNHNQISSINLNPKQEEILNLLNLNNNFAVDVLFGITGSGKTEIYIKRIKEILKNNPKGQILFLAPEIGLAELLLTRIRERLNYSSAVFHSEVKDGEKDAVFEQVKSGDLKIIVGTRSAIFLDFKDLALIIVDECHDHSYKQEEKDFFYNARDMAIVLAKFWDIPAILGSATPSLESWEKIQKGQWRCLKLEERALTQNKAIVSLENIRHLELIDGFSKRLLKMINRQLQNKRQAMIFINKRGYARKICCQNCGWTAICENCAKDLTLHFKEKELRCHHCQKNYPIALNCPKCKEKIALKALGSGTEKVELALNKHFPQARIVRLDTDIIKNFKEFMEKIAEIKRGDYDIVVGTQWLSKGFHFPKLDLAAIIDCDDALFSSDFRAEERLGQLLLQVGGRSGRETRGRVWIQTREVEQPIFQVFSHSYEEEAKRQLAEREFFNLPPFVAQVLLGAENTSLDRALKTLDFTKEGAMGAGIGKNWQWIGATPALMEKKNNKYQARILIQAENKLLIQKELKKLSSWLYAQAGAFNSKVFIDIDPLSID